MSITEQILKAKEKEVGIDMDDCSDMNILTTYFNAKDLADSLKIYKSSSERGYHFILKFKDSLSVNERLEIRRFLSDCKGRLYFSELRGGDDVLFTMKTQKGNWARRREINEKTLIYPYNARKFGR